MSTNAEVAKQTPLTAIASRIATWTFIDPANATDVSSAAAKARRVTHSAERHAERTLADTPSELATC
jgi:hypothetical protein